MDTPNQRLTGKYLRRLNLSNIGILHFHIFRYICRKLYTVEAKGNTTNAAYRSDALNLHVDLPYYDYIPNVSADD